MNSKKVQIRLLLLLIFFSFTEAGAQKLQVDSLERVLEEHRTDDTAKVNLLNRVALVLSAQDTKKSRSYAEQSEKLSKQLNYQKGKAASVWITGLTYIQSDKRLAISFIEEAVDIAEKAGDKAGASNYLMNIGNLKIEIGDVEKGEEYYDKAYRLAKELQDKKLIIIILYNLSRSQTRKGNYPKAIEQLQEVIRIENELGGRKMLATAYGQMGFIYSRQGSNPIALEYYLYAMEKASRMLEIKNQRLTIFCLTIVSLLVFILAFAIYWSNKLKKKVLQLKIENINHDLEMNQKAMAAATLKLVQSSERDANSIKILENVEKNTIEESQREIRSLIADYKFKSYTSNWEEFEIMFEKINSSFYEKLNTRYPTLTPNERKLCVFLKLNMSNNHISQITFQSEDALKKARLRLRKKLEIGREVNLTAFIQSL